MTTVPTPRPPSPAGWERWSPTDAPRGPDDTKVMGKPIGTPRQAPHQSITQEQTPGGLRVFGYAVLTDSGGAWILTFRDAAGAVRGKTCALSTSTADTSFVCH